ncbi:hypothetical protein BGZ76_004054 [Entomortierella beljakovae]|nr:hypothetical protein BGZ76_004054 [Entomortierella beljakovae]
MFLYLRNPITDIPNFENQNITEFAIPYLSHTNGEVRIATRKLIIDVCKFLNKTRVEQFLPGVKPLIIESIQKELVPKKARAQLANTSIHSRIGPLSSASNTTTTTTTSSALGTRTTTKPTGLGASTGKRRQVPTPLGVDLHMDSLKSLLVEPDSPGYPRSSRQSSKQKSDASVAHHARLKMPLRSSIKATQALYVGVPKAMVKKQSALSPDDDNDSTASDEVKLPLSNSVSPSRPSTQPTQSRVKLGSSLTPKNSSQDLRSEPQTTNEPARPNEERFCVFCDEHSNAFTDEGLVAHYWNECAMLANCSYCKIIIEVPTLSEHMIKECPKRKFVKQCDNCREIMSADSFLPHVASGCFAAPEDIVKCPLCQEILPSSNETDWKEHLLGGTGCPLNKKTKSKYSHPAKTQARASKVVTPVNTTRGYSASKPVPKESPTSPLSSSSSASMRTETADTIRHRSAMLSSTVSPASSTTSSVVATDKADTSHCSVGPLLVPLPLPPTLPHQNHHRPQQDVSPIHPLDPCPTMISHSESPISTGNIASGSNGNNSRIPKLGSFRSTSSNSVATSSWK